MNPKPKRPDAILYRDLEKQNDWLRSNVFDSMGNYLEEVEEQSPGDYIIMPENELSSFKIWWRSVSLTSVVLDFLMPVTGTQERHPTVPKQRFWMISNFCRRQQSA